MIPPIMPNIIYNSYAASSSNGSETQHSLNQEISQFLITIETSEAELPDAKKQKAAELKEKCLQRFTPLKILRFIDGFRSKRMEMDQMPGLKANSVQELLVFHALMSQYARYGTALDVWCQRETLPTVDFLRKVTLSFPENFWEEDVEIDESKLPEAEQCRRKFQLFLADIDRRDHDIPDHLLSKAMECVSLISKVISKGDLDKIEVVLSEKKESLIKGLGPKSSMDDVSIEEIEKNGFINFSSSMQSLNNRSDKQQISIVDDDLANVRACKGFLSGISVYSPLSILRGAALYLDSILKL